jgi:hypothetical protein
MSFVQARAPRSVEAKRLFLREIAKGRKRKLSSYFNKD